jgi:FkbM family methyltransferase
MFVRFYRRNYKQWLPLYESASLKLTPAITMELLPGDVISDYIAFTGVYERRLTRRILELARSGGTFIDVGANLGYFTLLWAGSNPGNKCIAFEAAPRNIDILRRNISRNRLDAQVDVVPSAAGATPGTLRFDVGPADQTGWGGFTLDEGSARSIDVTVVRVDDLVGPDDTIALLKVDIEGADTWALLGCERLLKAGAIKEIWYEQHKPRMRSLGISLDDHQRYLKRMGYLSIPNTDPAGEIVEWHAVPA